MKRCWLKTDFEKLTKAELIDLLISDTSVPSGPRPAAKVARVQRPIQLSEYAQGKVAFKLFYLGQRYSGNASQVGFKSRTSSAQYQDGIEIRTIEDTLFKALVDLRLVDGDDRARWDFSRAGRTDAGVSAVHQIVALRIRTSTQKLGKASALSDYPEYCKLLNHRLPEDIRILAWAPVSDAFNARFDCRYREYRYLFPITGLDLGKMKLACSYMVGEHDFCNLSIPDPSKPAGYSTVRHILLTDLQRDNDVFWHLQIRANGFLYHQIRCIMAVLLEIGRGKQPPEYIQDLLSLKKPRPTLPLADPLPLVFYDACYDPDKLTLPPLDASAVRSLFIRKATEELIVRLIHPSP
jgi:tRNA pseudouridine38/39 synthase